MINHLLNEDRMDPVAIPNLLVKAILWPLAAIIAAGLGFVIAWTSIY
jgi:hypothetical protein